MASGCSPSSSALLSPAGWEPQHLDQRWPCEREVQASRPSREMQRRSRESDYRIERLGRGKEAPMEMWSSGCMVRHLHIFRSAQPAVCATSGIRRGSTAGTQTFPDPCRHSACALRHYTLLTIFLKSNFKCTARSYCNAGWPVQPLNA